MAARTFSNLEFDFRTYVDGTADMHADVSHWWFTIADEAWHNRRCQIPYNWGFHPSPLGPVNDPEDMATAAALAATDQELMRFGEVLHRYAGRLRRAGMAYSE